MKRNRVKNCWIIFLSLVAVLATGYGVYKNLEPVDDNVYVIESDYSARQLNNYYHQSLYQLTDSMKNISANLGKISVSNNNNQQLKLLILVEGAADAANRDLALLPIADNSVVEKSIKYTNQVADYAKYLVEKLSAGTPLSTQERANLSHLEEVASELAASLNKLSMDSHKSFTIVKDEGGNRSLSVNTEDIDENTFDYPKLIYDGPYSDAVQKKQINTGKTITAEEGEMIIRRILSAYGITNIQFRGIIDNKATVMAYEVRTKDGQYFSISLTTDGRLYQLDGMGSDEEHQTTMEKVEVDLDSMKQVAEEFCRKVGYNVKPIWTSLPIEDRVYVNLCYVQDDIIVYPDMIKVALDVNTKKVVGFEGFGYLSNHKEREVPSAAATVEDAMKKLTPGLEVVGINKAIIPVGSKEYYCYEFTCEKGNDTYLIYIDADVLVERDIFKVVEGIEGYSVI